MIAGPESAMHALEGNRVDPNVLLSCFQRHMDEDGNKVTRAQFEENLAGKRGLVDFRQDVEPLLRPGLSWDFDTALDRVLDELIAHLPGDPWKGGVADDEA